MIAAANWIPSPRFLFSIILLTFILPKTPALPQNNSYDQEWRWVHFTTESGLPDNLVVRVLETSDGTPWALTAAGLAWYDGYRWHRPDTSIGTPRLPQFATNDLAGNILVVIDSFLYRGNQRGFRRLPFTHPRFFVALSEDTLLVLSNDSMLLYTGDEVRPLPNPPPFFPRYEPMLWRTESNRIWFSNGASLYQYHDGHWREFISIDTESRSVIGKVIAENQYGTGIVSIFGPSGGLWEWSAINPPRKNPRELGNLTLNLDIAEDGRAAVLYHSGEIRIRQEGRWMSPLLPSRIKMINYLRFRQNGDLWICTSNGLYLHRHSNRRWIFRYWRQPDARNNVNEILLSQDGSIWLATGNGLDIIRRDGSTTTIQQILNQPLFTLTGLAEDRERNIWISSGSGFEGTYRWNGKEWDHFAIAEKGKRIYVHKIRSDRQGRLWFLGLSNRYPPVDSLEPGAYVLESERFVRWSTEEGLLSGRVYAFTQSPDSALWFGTWSGLNRWKKGQWTYWSLGDDLKDKVSSIEADREGRVWFSDGLFGLRYIDSTDQIQKVTASDGLTHNHVLDIRADDAGRLWVSTLFGLSLRQDGMWINIDTEQGLPSPAIWPIFPRGDSIFLGTFGKGLAILDIGERNLPAPRVLISKPSVEEESAFLKWKSYAYWGDPPPQSILTRFRLDNKPWSVWSTENNTILEGIPAGNHRFQVQARSLFGSVDEQGTTVTFTVPQPLYKQPLFLIGSLGTAASLIVLVTLLVVRKRRHNIELRASEARFRRLTESTFEGIIIHDNGTIIDINQSALRMFGYEPNEKPGDSIFVFIAPESRALVQQHISSHSQRPYEAIGLKRGGTTINLELIGRDLPFGDRTVRVKAIRDITPRKEAEKKLLAYQDQLRSLAAELATTEERERRRTATYLHDYIGQTLALCKIQLGYVTQPHSREQGTRHVQEVRTLLDQMIRDIRSLTFELSPPVLYELGFEEALEWLTEQFQQSHGLVINYTNDGKRKPLNSDVKTLLFHSVRELLVNVVKHANARSAQLSVARTDGLICIHVRDDGIGFRTGLSTPEMGSTITTGGYGLFNIRERLSHIGGRLEIVSENGQGTTATLVAPVADNKKKSQADDALYEP